MSELARVPEARLVAIPSRTLPADRSPARVYLARLGPRLPPHDLRR
jgi:hypothetical protein